MNILALTAVNTDLPALGEDIALQGEFCGAGIQKNRLKLFEPTLYVFDVIRIGEGDRRQFQLHFAGAHRESQREIRKRA